MKPLVPVFLLWATLGWAQGADPHLTTKAPYPVPTAAPTPAPAGFQPVFVNAVGRHGSRHLSSAKYDLTLFNLLTVAEKDGQLTPLGARLKADLARLLDVEKNRYGLLTQAGRDELRALGERTARAYPGLFVPGATVRATATFETRTQESRDEFLAGLTAGALGLKVAVSASLEKQDPLLRPFDNAPRYQEWADKGPWKKVEEAYAASPVGKAFDERVVTQFVSPAFYARLSQGEFKLKDASGKVKLKNPTDAATNLYNLHIISAGLRREGSFDFGQYFRPEELAWYESLVDMDDFYSKGPSDGTTLPVDLLAPLVRDLLETTDAAVAGRAPEAAVFRFGHAETMIPLAAFLEIPGAATPSPDPQKVASVWRGSQVSPMGATVQWVVYRKGTTVLVKMLHNEREVAFPVATTTFPYYPWDAVKAYYQKKVAALGFAVGTTAEENLKHLETAY